MVDASRTSPTVVIAAGGTGGHIYPGLAVARAIERADPTATVVFVGTARGLEQGLVPDAGYELILLDMVPFAGRDRIRFPLAFARASFQARAMLRQRRASVVLSMGGYAGVAALAGARLAGVPAVLHESGSIPGRANLLGARFTRDVAIALPSAERAFRSGCRVRLVGMPLAEDLVHFDRAELRPEARRRAGLTESTFSLLVTGGSQGAASLNRLALGLAARWRDRSDVRIVLKAGSHQHDEVARQLASAPGAALIDLVRFIDRMDLAYAAADMAITRAGAGTVAELAVVGLPAVLVPYPHAPRDHQTVNAGELVDAGGALLVADADADADVVGPLIEARMDDPALLEQMAKGLASVAKHRAAEDLAAWVLELGAHR